MTHYITVPSIKDFSVRQTGWMQWQLLYKGTTYYGDMTDVLKKEHYLTRARAHRAAHKIVARRTKILARQSREIPEEAIDSNVDGPFKRMFGRAHD